MEFSYYLIILKDKKIQSLYKLLLKKKFDINSKNTENPKLI